MRFAWVMAVALATACGVAGCVVNEPSAPPRGVVVSGPPPAPIPEAMRPPPPSPTSAWVAGYWHWTGMQYAWIPGHWENAPPGTTWAAPRYVTMEGSTFYEAGAWRPAAVSGPSAPPAHANALR